MKQIFPKEILEFTADVHRFRHKKRSLAIYGLILLFICGTLIMLPLVKVPVFLSSRCKINDGATPDVRLEAECTINAGDVAMIRENTPVIFHLDAFDHNQWGIATGKILQVGREAEWNDKQAVFYMRCSLNEAYLSLPTRHRAYLRNGQTLTAHIKITERSLLELMRDRWHDWLEPGSSVQ